MISFYDGFLLLLMDRVGTPFCLSQLINYFNKDSQMPIEYAFLYATAVVVGATFTAFSNHIACFHAQRLGMRVRVATSSLIFRKAKLNQIYQ